MKVFISYSRHDDGAVRSMVGDLQRAGVQVWLDEDLGGGDAWWTEILNEIRACTVFLFALTENSLYSKPCRAELGYAQALGLPILPVQIGEVSSYRADPIFSRQLIDYRQPTAATGLALMGALDVHAAHHNELPEPLPEAPPIPYEYLQRLGASIHDPAVLAPPAQAQMLFELRNALCEEDDPTVLYDIRKLLRTLRRRADVTYPIANEIDTVLSKAAADSSQAAAKDTAMASAGQNGLGTDDDVTYTSGSHVDEETTEQRMPARDGTEAVAKSVRHDASAVSGDSGEVVATTVAATTASSTDVARPADRPDAPKSRSQVTEESRGLGSVSPTQTTSTSEKSPLLHWLKRLFHRLNRRTKIVLVAVAVIVVAAVAVVITVERQPDPT
jgi:serine/threonine kinase PknH